MLKFLRLACLALSLCSPFAMATDLIVPATASTVPGGELRYDLSLSGAEQTKFILWSAAMDMKAKLAPTLVTLVLLAWAIFRYGRQIWLRFTDRHIGRRGLIVMVLMLLPLSYTANVVAWSKRAAFGEVPPQALAVWKYGTDDMTQVPTYPTYSAAIPK